MKWFLKNPIEWFELPSILQGIFALALDYEARRQERLLVGGTFSFVFPVIEREFPSTTSRDHEESRINRNERQTACFGGLFHCLTACVVLC